MNKTIVGILAFLAGCVSGALCVLFPIAVVVGKAEEAADQRRQEDCSC